MAKKAKTNATAASAPAKKVAQVTNTGFAIAVFNEEWERLADDNEDCPTLKEFLMNQNDAATIKLGKSMNGSEKLVVGAYEDEDDDGEEYTIKYFRMSLPGKQHVDFKIGTKSKDYDLPVGTTVKADDIVAVQFTNGETRFETL